MRIPARFSEHPVETFLAGGLLLLLLLVSSVESGPTAPGPANSAKAAQAQKM